MRDPRDVIVKPFLTEKSTIQRESDNIYTFCVARDANKREIKHAVEEIFQVEVKDVRTMNYLGKMRRMGRFVGRKSSWKKATVQLVPGASISIFEGL